MLRTNALFVGFSLGLAACAADGTKNGAESFPEGHVGALGDAAGAAGGILIGEPSLDRDSDGFSHDERLVPKLPGDGQFSPIVPNDPRPGCAQLQSGPFNEAVHLGDVTDLSQLGPETRRVLGNVTISADDSVSSLAALRCLRSIEGTLQIEKLENVKRLAMPELRQVGTIEIREMPALIAISMPELQMVDWVSVQDAPLLERIRMPRVQNLNQGLALESVPVTSLDGVLPALEAAGAVSLVDLPHFEAFDHGPIDLDGGDVELTGLDLLEGLEGFPFTSVGFIEVIDNPVLTSTLGASMLDGSGGEVTNNPLLSDLTLFAGVSSVESLYLSTNPGLEGLAELAELTMVRGDLTIANHANLRQYDGIYGIQSVGGDLRITEATALSAEELTALEAALDGIAIEGELVVSAGE